jgi:hypothetical protein
MRREILEGKDIVRRKSHHGSGVHSVGELTASPQHWLQRLSGLVVGDNDDDRLSSGPRQ